MSKRITMIQKLAFSVLTLACAAAGHAATTACGVSASSLKGSYGMLVSGQTTSATPVTKFLAGAVTFDGTSALSGANIFGSGGTRSSLSGNYSLNSDCTLTLTTVINGKSSAYTVAIKATGEAVGIEVDASAVSTIYLKPQVTATFNNASINGAYAASCGGFLGAYSDLNLVTFSNGTLSGTDPYNNAGSFVVANNPYTGSYSVNADGTFSGTANVGGALFDYFGVISNSNTQVQYFYTNVSGGLATDAIASCSGRTAKTT